MPASAICPTAAAACASLALGAATAERLDWPQLTWVNELKVEGQVTEGERERKRDTNTHTCTYSQTCSANTPLILSYYPSFPTHPSTLPHITPSLALTLSPALIHHSCCRR